MLTNYDLKQIKEILVSEIEPLKRDVSGLKRDLKDVKKRVKKTEKTIDTMIGLFDKEIVKTQRRVSKIEDHLNL